MWMGAVKKDGLLISYIMSIMRVTIRGGIVSPGYERLQEVTRKKVFSQELQLAVFNAPFPCFKI